MPLTNNWAEIHVHSICIANLRYFPHLPKQTNYVSHTNNGSTAYYSTRHEMQEFQLNVHENAKFYASGRRKK